MALTEYSLTYEPIKVMKCHIVHNFIMDQAIVEVTQIFVDLKHWRLFFDASRHTNGSGIGILIISPEGILTKFKFKIKELFSNSEAEYEALIAGLRILLDLGTKGVEVKGK